MEVGGETHMLRIRDVVFRGSLILNRRLIALRENCIMENLTVANVRGRRTGMQTWLNWNTKTKEKHARMCIIQGMFSHVIIRAIIWVWMGINYQTSVCTPTESVLVKVGQKGKDRSIMEPEWAIWKTPKPNEVKTHKRASPSSAVVTSQKKNRNHIIGRV